VALPHQLNRDTPTASQINTPTPAASQATPHAGESQANCRPEQSQDKLPGTEEFGMTPESWYRALGP
jgi:hypothetical protein